MHVVLPRGVRWGAGQIVTVYNSPSLLRGSNIHDHFLLEHTLLINPSPYPCPSLLTAQSFSPDTYCKTLIWMDQRPGFRLCQPRRNSVTSSAPRCRLATGRPDHRPRRQRLVVARRPRRTSDHLGFDSPLIVQLWVQLGIDMGKLSQSLQSAQFIAYTRGPRPVSQPMRGPVYARRFQLISQPAG
jgi:hypothetical protein